MNGSARGAITSCFHEALWSWVRYDMFSLHILKLSTEGRKLRCLGRSLSPPICTHPGISMALCIHILGSAHT